MINYGMGNLGSVRRALEECGAAVSVSERPDDLRNADRIVLPGVGAFSEGMANLQNRGWIPRINEALQNPKVAMLGICLGMQLLGEKGYEGGENAGLGLIPGEVKRFVPPTEDTRIPHVGWNEIQLTRSHPLLAGIGDGTDFYFVHSYHFAAPSANVLATTPYCDRFASVIGTANVFGTQFHPEKSSSAGFQLLRNYLSPSLIDA